MRQAKRISHQMCYTQIKCENLHLQKPNVTRKSNIFGKKHYTKNLLSTNTAANIFVVWSGVVRWYSWSIWVARCHGMASRSPEEISDFQEGLLHIQRYFPLSKILLNNVQHLGERRKSTHLNVLSEGIEAFLEIVNNQKSGSFVFRMSPDSGRQDVIELLTSHRPKSILDVVVDWTTRSTDGECHRNILIWDFTHNSNRSPLWARSLVLFIHKLTPTSSMKMTSWSMHRRLHEPLCKRESIFLESAQSSVGLEHFQAFLSQRVAHVAFSTTFILKLEQAEGQWT